LSRCRTSSQPIDAIADLYREDAIRAGAVGILQKSDIVQRGRDAVVSAYLEF
jgi:hypothetical protein